MIALLFTCSAAIGDVDNSRSNEHVPPVRMAAKLPGVPSTAPYTYFSGYLDAGTPPSGKGRMFFHYICAMADNWQDMPLSIWYNGGPGAPSTFGLFQEFGPFLLTAESYKTANYAKTGVPTPIFNPWTWANVTSLCEIDSPAPMGASYCTEGNGSATSHGGPSGDPYTCGPWSDKSTAAANHRAHIAFFQHAFPEFEASQQPVTLVGESCARIQHSVEPARHAASRRLARMRPRWLLCVCSVGSLCRPQTPACTCRSLRTRGSTIPSAAPRAS